MPRKSMYLIRAITVGVVALFCAPSPSHNVVAAPPGAAPGMAWSRPEASNEEQKSSSRRVSLNGSWQLTYGPQPREEPETARPSIPPDWTTIPAKVPGNVELDMVAAGKLEEPLVGNRVLKLRDLEAYQWWYRRTFSSPTWQKGERIHLVFDGLDCFGKIWLNGKVVGTTDNMLIPHRFDVTGYLQQSGGNELTVRIDSPVLEGRKFAPTPFEFGFQGHWEATAVRKAKHMYAFDIMPRVVSAGLWRDVALEIIRPTHWRSAYWTTLRTDPKKRTASLLVDWDFASDRANIDDLRIRITLMRRGQIAYQDEEPVLATHGRRVLALKDVDLWWPRGYGDPALYEATLALVDAHGTVLDEHRCRAGLRRIELHRTDITTKENPGDFTFLVNGERVFVRGANWDSLDVFHSRDGQHLKLAADMLVDLNCNMIRCFGGNIYADHDLLDLCDENGVMVWQEFALSTGRYPQTPEFAAQMRHEAEVIVDRLRNHPSLALWAGGNENDSIPGPLNIDPNADRITRQVLPEVVRQFDPMRAYLPNSPYYSPELVRLGRRMDMMPEVHLWGPRGYYKAPFYTDVNAHFVSEIGYHGCPNRRSLEQMFDPEYVYPWVKEGQWNDEWLTKSVRWHSKSKEYDGRNDLMVNQVRHLFGTVPTNLDDFIAASQMTQAEALKFFIEFWRQDKWRRSGIIWWNLRDGWPIISDAIVDYYNRKKLAYAYIKRVQANVVAICGEPIDGRHPMLVVNDTLQPAKGHLTVRNADGDRKMLDADFEVESNGKVIVSQIPHAVQPEMWLIDWQLSDGSKFRSHYLAGNPPVRIEDYRRWMRKLGLPPEAEWVKFGIDGVQ